jgi:hypothetical protein
MRSGRLHDFLRFCQVQACALASAPRSLLASFVSVARSLFSWWAHQNIHSVTKMQVNNITTLCFDCENECILYHNVKKPIRCVSLCSGNLFNCGTVVIVRGSFPCPSPGSVPSREDGSTGVVIHTGLESIYDRNDEDEFQFAFLSNPIW